MTKNNERVKKSLKILGLIAILSAAVLEIADVIKEIKSTNVEVIEPTEDIV